jgi:hypothetical protein
VLQLHQQLARAAPPAILDLAQVVVVDRVAMKPARDSAKT